MIKSLQHILEEQFLHKKIVVPIAERDQRGKIIPNRFTECAGTCQYVGQNQLMGWELQVVIDEMPLPVRHLNDIKIQPERKQIRR